MRKFSLFVLIAVLFAGLVSIPAFADSYEQTGYVKSEGGACAVWGPSYLRRQDEYALRYSGGCKNGLAEGKGKAEWLFRLARMKPKSVWEGKFRQGVFLNGNKINGAIEPAPGDRYLVPQGKAGDADLLFVSRSAQDGPLELCRVESLRLSLPSGANAANGERVKNLMREAGKRYRQACPNDKQEIRVGIHTTPFKVTPNHLLPDPQAEARVNASGELAGYYNKASDAAQQEKTRAQYQQKQAESRQRFYDFSRKNDIHAWVTPRQLEENPFRWEDKIVGMRVRLDKMLTRDSALIRAVSRDEWATMRLVGITPDFPGSQQSVLLAARVGKRETLPGAPDGHYLTLSHINSRLCEQGNCSDWFMGTGNEEINWDKPFSPR